jgi:hypothetical protein
MDEDSGWDAASGWDEDPGTQDPEVWGEDYDDAHASVGEEWGDSADNGAWDSMNEDSGWDAASGWDEE